MFGVANLIKWLFYSIEKVEVVNRWIVVGFPTKMYLDVSRIRILILDKDPLPGASGLGSLTAG